MGAIWTDYDGDGWPDLFVTNDTMPNFLLHNNRDGTLANNPDHFAGNVAFNLIHQLHRFHNAQHLPT